MLSLSLCIVLLCKVHAEKLLFAQMILRHGLRTPSDTYANDPYDEDFFGVPDEELLPKGMEQHFIRGQQLKKIYVDEKKLVSAKYSRRETYVRAADSPRCSQSALANLAGFYAGSPTFPAGVPNWPSSWTPIPIHTVPKNADYVLEGVEDCPRLEKLKIDRQTRKEFRDFLESNSQLIETVNANSGNPVDYSFQAIRGMAADLHNEKAINLTLPDWITDEFYSDLVTAFFEGNDYINGGAGFGLPVDQEMVKMKSGFLLKDWMDNMESVINGMSTLKLYVYQGHDMTMNVILMGLGVKEDLIGQANSDFASVIACELWEKDGQYVVKLLYSPNIGSGFEEFTRKVPGCGSDLCPLADFKSLMEPLIAKDITICEV